MGYRGIDCQHFVFFGGFPRWFGLYGGFIFVRFMSGWLVDRAARSRIF